MEQYNKNNSPQRASNGNAPVKIHIPSQANAAAPRPRPSEGTSVPVPQDQDRRKVVNYAKSLHAPKSEPATAAASGPAQMTKSAWEELKEQAVLSFESGLLPRSIDTPQKAITIALMGKELGLSPLQSLCGIYVVNGMAALRGALMLRLIYERVSGANITVQTPPEMADKECVVEMRRPNGQPHRFRYTIEDARRAGFMNKPLWQQHTATMLRWAAIRTGARVVFADAIAGCYMEDELPGASQGASDAPDVPMVPLAAPTATTAAAAPAPAPVAPVVEKAAPVMAKPAPAPAAKAEETPSSWPVMERMQVRDLPSLKPITDKQVNRLFAIAYGKGWSRQRVLVQMEKQFRKKDAKSLSRVEYDKLCNFILTSNGADSGGEKPQPVAG